MKTYAPRPDKHALEILLEGKSGKDKQKAKVREFKKISMPLTYVYEDIDITINSLKEDGKGLLKIDATTKKDGKILDIEQDYRFQNPPVKKGNGTFRKETTEAGEIDVENQEVDILGSLKEFLGQAIKTQLR